MSSIRRSLKLNNISAVPSGVFTQQGKLEKLHLSDNIIGELSHGVFNGLSSLKRLFLESNRIKKFPLSILEDLYSLELLNLSNNLLKLQDDQFPLLGRIYEMWVHYRRVRHARDEEGIDEHKN